MFIPLRLPGDHIQQPMPPEDLGMPLINSQVSRIINTQGINSDGDIRQTIEGLQPGNVSLDFIQQTPKGDYSELVRAVEKEVFTDDRALRADYDSMWTAYGVTGVPGIKESIIIDQFDVALPDSIVCDLGGFNGGSVGMVAASRNAQLFINVDRYPRGHKDPTLTQPTIGCFRNVEFKSGLTKTILIPGIHKTIDVISDMLDFVSRLQEASVNISINGIDDDLIRREDYHQAMAREILRVTRKKGIIFGNNSTALSIIANTIEADPVISEEFNIIYRKDGVIVIRRK